MAAVLAVGVLVVLASTAATGAAQAADLRAQAPPSAAAADVHRRLVLLNRKLATMIFEASNGRLAGDALERDVKAVNDDFGEILRRFPTVRRTATGRLLVTLSAADLSLEDAGLSIAQGSDDFALRRLRGVELALRSAALEAARSLSPNVRVGAVRLRALANDVMRLRDQLEQGKLEDGQVQDELRRVRDRKHAIVRAQLPALFGVRFLSYLLDVESWDRAVRGILFPTPAISGGQPDALRDLRTMKRAKERIEARVANAVESSPPSSSTCVVKRNFFVSGAGTPRTGSRSFGLRVLFPKGSKIERAMLFDTATGRRPTAAALGELLQWEDVQREVTAPAGLVGREYLVKVSYKPGETGTALSRELWGFSIEYAPPQATACNAVATEIKPSSGA